MGKHIHVWAERTEVLITHEKKTHRSSFQASASSNKARLMEKKCFYFSFANREAKKKKKKHAKNNWGNRKSQLRELGPRGAQTMPPAPGLLIIVLRKSNKCAIIYLEEALVSVCFTGVCPRAWRNDSLGHEEGPARLLLGWQWAGGDGRAAVASPGSSDRRHWQFWGAEG